MKAKRFDRKFDESREIVDQLDLTKAHRLAEIQAKIADGYASAQRGELFGPDEVRAKLDELKRKRSK